MESKKKEMKCLKCGHEWITNNACTTCVECDYTYVKWVNYEDWQKWYDKECEKM